MDLDALNLELVSTVLSRPPFIQVDGVYNIRDMHHRTPQSTCACSTDVKPGLIFRSGEVSGMTEQGIAQFQRYGIHTVYDMRSEPETHKWGSSMVPDIPNVEFVRTPVFKDVDYSPENMVNRYRLYASGKEEAFMQLYSEILEAAGPAYRTILLHARDRPSSPFAFNCTAGKDRTGILAALILKLAGVCDACIAQDYALTRIGREPAREKVMARLRQEPMFKDDNQQMLNMFQCRAETMLAFLRLLNERYGGAEGYLISHADLTSEDLAVIRGNITETAGAASPS